MNDSSTEVVGHMLYLEFRHDKTSYQMMMFPPLRSSTSAVMPFTVFRRQISPAVARRQWRCYTGPKPSPAMPGPGSAEVQASTWLTSLTDSTMQQLSTRGWTLYKEPIVVELTQKDVDDAARGKLAYKALGRVNKARKFLSFEDYWKQS